MPIDLTKVYASGSKFPYALGQEVPLGQKIFRFMKYNDGSNNIPGLRGQIVYNCVVAAVDITTPYEVSVDLGSTAPLTDDEFAGIIQPDVVLTGEGFWGQIYGPGEVNLWASAAITQITTALTHRLRPAATNGIVASLADGATGEPQQWFASLLANVDGTPTAATDRFLATIPAGPTTTVKKYIVGETVTANAKTGIVAETLNKNSITYGIIAHTLSAAWAAAETAVGGTSAASGVIGTIGYIIPAVNYRIIRQ